MSLEKIHHHCVAIVCVLLASFSCSTGRLSSRAEPGPEVLIVLRDGVGDDTPAERAEQRRILTAHLGERIGRHLTRDGFIARETSSPEPSAQSGYDYVLTLQLRRYTPGNAAARVTGRLFGLSWRPGPRDAATLRAAYQLRTGEGRLMRTGSLTGSSRRSWEDAADQVCSRTAREVALALRESEEG